MYGGVYEAEEEEEEDKKPYTPSIDRIEKPETPKWCAHWPKSYEQSGSFDWNEFLFAVEG